MRYIIFIMISLINSNIFSQKMIQNYYEVKMNKISMENFDKTINYRKLKDNEILSFKPIKWIKITLSGRYNGNVFSKFNSINGVDNMDDNLTINDYFNITQYDARIKFYLNKRIRIINRLEISPRKLYFFSGGIIIKF